MPFELSSAWRSWSVNAVSLMMNSSYFPVMVSDVLLISSVLL